MIIPTAKILKKVDEYFFSSKLRMIAQMREKGIPVINLGIGNPDLMPDSSVIDKISEEIIKSENHGYQPYKGSLDFLSAMAKWYEKYFKVDFVAEKNFLPLLGSKEGLNFIFHAFINPGDEVLVPNPGYPTYTSAALLNYAKVKYYDLLPENNFFPDFEQIQKLITKQTKIMIINYPHMPTGIGATEDLFVELVEFAQKNKILLVNDNPYNLLHKKQLSIFKIKEAQEVAIELNSLSKSHNMAGWRIGMAVANEDYINALLKIRSNNNSGHFKPVQAAAIQALSLNNNWYVYLREIYNERRIIVENALKNMDFKVHKNQAGMFVWARIPENFSSGVELSDFLLENASVFVTAGKIFGTNGEKYIRISLTNNIDVLFEAFRRIKLVLQRIERIAV